MTKREFENICKWLELNANASKFRNVYEMLDSFRTEFANFTDDELTFNKGVWATIQCLAIDHRQPISASFVANDMRITKKEAKEYQKDSGYYSDLMDEVIYALNE